MNAWCVSGCTLVVYMQSSCYSIAKQWVVWAQLRWSFLLVILFNNDLLQAIQVRVWLIQAVLLRNLKSIISIYSASCHLCCSLVTDSGKDLGEQNEKLAGTWLTISVPILKKTATTCLSVGGLLWTLILISKMFNTELCESMVWNVVEREKIPEKIWDQLGFDHFRHIVMFCSQRMSMTVHIIVTCS